ncbi:MULTISPECIES: hypothetical protein [Halorussus]|uniref:hypothetical protein n=1 Tax=Halorussus TaxID=1070314 RepID=UPI0020A0B9BA|nr:hypothetical protein [Halorussus vallis]USZ78702.1 hypothetical protein NGM07_24640 [Halorussus vallis]
MSEIEIQLLGVKHTDDRIHKDIDDVAELSLKDGPVRCDSIRGNEPGPDVLLGGGVLRMRY